ncbi:hypothetical protein L861_19270 [Litchfieldella anticariensis FP35 = DSM 16096]|uniref:Uncharacterized protein n=1 Tax=Litchfieldella anticariensis (strain DSM 16096 / CECT 5854 / CIP 108499 / LMG 22089 / FP35) TaxID=1121939 RepID=S2LG57_LITA3|nr:hypothetical protein [Halomonas anticariensis]EPC03676.1 hypothetical protein L861_19270 [Halomonas anticariensis FP35 = DSM 16096]
MPEVRIAPGAVHVFPTGQLDENLELENRHNVAGPVMYQIAVRPVVTINMTPDEEYQVQGVNGQQLTVTNNLPNSLYCRWG